MGERTCSPRPTPEGQLLPGEATPTAGQHWTEPGAPLPTPCVRHGAVLPLSPDDQEALHTPTLHTLARDARATPCHGLVSGSSGSDRNRADSCLQALTSSTFTRFLMPLACADRETGVHQSLFHQVTMVMNKQN